MSIEGGVMSEFVEAALPLDVPEPEPEPEPTPLKLTERQVLDLLARRYDYNAGNGQRWVIAEHVRNAAGFDATRTADFIAMDTWPSKGLALHGHEVKVSRSDWLRERADPSKAEAFKRHMDYWWLVAPVGVAKPDEMPDGWGLMVVGPRGEASHLRVQREAPRLTPPPGRYVSRYNGGFNVAYSGAPDLPRSMMAALLRAVAQTARNRGGTI